MHPDTERVFRELQSSGIDLTEKNRQMLSMALDHMELELEWASDNYFIAHPEAQEANFVVYLIQDEKTKVLGFSVAVGEANIADLAKHATAILMEGKLAR